MQIRQYLKLKNIKYIFIPIGVVAFSIFTSYVYYNFIVPPTVVNNESEETLGTEITPTPLPSLQRKEIYIDKNGRSVEISQTLDKYGVILKTSYAPKFKYTDYVSIFEKLNLKKISEDDKKLIYSFPNNHTLTLYKEGFIGYKSKELTIKEDMQITNEMYKDIPGFVMNEPLAANPTVTIDYFSYIYLYVIPTSQNGNEYTYNFDDQNFKFIVKDDEIEVLTVVDNHHLYTFDKNFTEIKDKRN